MDTPQSIDRTDPKEAFALLGDDTRIDILRALWNGGEQPFSDLREAVDVRDSGQFNYHLDKLVGQFVAKTDDGRYELTEAGRQINGAIEAGAYTSTGEIEPIALDRSCSACGGSKTLTYESERVTVECDSCDVGSAVAVPPSAFAGCSPEEIPAVAGRYLRLTLRHIGAGFCSYCDGPIETRVCPVTDSVVWNDAIDPEATPVDPDSLPIVQYTCKQCGATPTNSLPVALLDHPTVVRFYDDHGVDLRERSIWEFVSYDPDRQEIRRRDPVRASVTYGVDGDELTVVVDETLTAVETD